MGGRADAPGPDDASQTDAPDTQPDLCFGAFMRVCLTALPSSAITVNSGEARPINTAPGSTDCVATTPAVNACVVAATSITVNANGSIRGIGSRALILLATDSIQINNGGVIDVSSKRGASVTGAGANASRCGTGSNPTAQTGGWGGSNATKGGNGNRAGAGAGGGEAAAALPQPTTLVGGCAGIRGASGAGGKAGAGGGAVDLIASAIIIDGTINASGSGADGATTNAAGGGGGGSGGLIVLDTPNLTLNGTAQVLAQGGSGGEGATGSSAGGDGTDPTMPGTAAPGGSGGGSAGNGGSGATTDNGGNGGDDGFGFGDGGGGGGGGAGFIKTTDPSPPTLPTSSVCPALS